MNWEAYSLDHSDERWGVARSVINSQGKYQSEKYPKTFKSEAQAQRQAELLQAVAQAENG